MPPKGRLKIGTNVGIDRERAYRDRIASLEQSQVREVPLLLIDEIRNVRRSYDQEGIRELASSIEKRGLLQPVLLSENGTRFTIQAGHRRVPAFRLLKKETIPALIRPAPEHLDEVQLIENIQREDPSPADLELALRSLVERVGSQEAAAQVLRKSKQWVCNILAASKVRETVASTLEERGVRASVPSGHLRDLASLPSAEQAEAAKQALEAGGGKRAFRAAAAKSRQSNPSAKDPLCILSATIRAFRNPDGTVEVRPEISGTDEPGVRSLFAEFCGRLEKALHSCRKK